MPDVRPMTEADVPAVGTVQVAAFADLARRFGQPERPVTPQMQRRTLARVRHCLATTPAGAWVAADGDRVVGVALGIEREGLWGLSLLVVDPPAQSGGLGRALLAGALTAAEGTRGGIILASEDHRALRAYQRAGFELRPSFDAGGPVKRPPVRPATVREGRWPQDRGLCDVASRVVRGAAHGDDVGQMVELGAHLLVHDGGGFAVLREGGDVTLLAAQDEAVARELLRAALAAAAAAGVDAEVAFLDAGQAWAMDELLEAGVPLRPGGAVCVRGETGPMRPFLPSGAYL